MFDRIINRTFQDKSTDVEISYGGLQAWKALSDKFSVTPKDIIEIQESKGFDIASWVLYKSFKERLSYKKLNVFLDQKRETYKKEHKEYLVFVLDHNPWLNRKDSESYQWRMKNMASSAGFDVSFPQVGYRRSMYHNAYYYQELLKRFPGRKVIFVSHSLASLELRWMLEKSVDLGVKTVGWLNIAGLVYGTSLTTTKGWNWYLKRQFMGEYDVPANISRSQGYCYRGFQWDENKIPMVSVLPFKPRHMYPWFEDNEKHELDPWGPHDGYINHCDYLKAKHPVWPVWREGHQLTVESIQARLQSCLMHFVHKDKLNNKPGNSLTDRLNLDTSSRPQNFI